MGGNQLCGLDIIGRGTYTTEGITKLCEGLKGSAVTSLEYAAALFSPFCQRPLTHICIHIGIYIHIHLHFHLHCIYKQHFLPSARSYLCE